MSTFPERSTSSGSAVPSPAARRGPSTPALSATGAAPLRPSREGEGSLAHVIETLLDKGLVLNADIMVSVAGVELLGIRLRAALASFETAARYGLEFPSGTDTETAAWRQAREEKETCPECGKRVPVEQLLHQWCPWCGWRSAQAQLHQNPDHGTEHGLGQGAEHDTDHGVRAVTGPRDEVRSATGDDHDAGREAEDDAESETGHDSEPETGHDAESETGHDADRVVEGADAQRERSDGA
ncbi:gas vesicle protein [Streptomyces sp. REN17]|uniref:gas vesicle protein n=1 Tax=Streptomyces beigongshangae TaxID=2841597 RepID=UPI0027DFC3FF|nr:gas vesicle protein [Streptomyces sp. REN17]